MHPDRETLGRLIEDALSEAEAKAVRAHLGVCEECAKAMMTIERSRAELDAAWTQKRLTGIAAKAHWPTREDLMDYFLDDLPSAEARRGVEAHLRACAACRDILEEYARGAADLMQADPLREYGPGTRPARDNWREALRSLLRPTAWPAWTLAAVSVVVFFALGALLRPALWPAGSVAPPELTMQIPIPPLARHTDGSLVLGIGPGVRPEARALLTEALVSHGTPEFAVRALPALERAVAADPNFEQARFWLGVCLLLKENVAAAIPHLEEAARLAPGNVTYRHYLVWGYLRAGEYAKALAAQTRLLKGTK